MELKESGWLTITKYGTDFIECEWEQTNCHYTLVIHELSQNQNEKHLIHKCINQSTSLHNNSSSIKANIKLVNIKLVKNQKYKIYIHSVNSESCLRSAMWNDFTLDSQTPDWVSIKKYGTDFIECAWDNTSREYRFLLFELDKWNNEKLVRETNINSPLNCDVFQIKIDLNNVKLIQNQQYRIYVHSLQNRTCSSSAIRTDFLGDLDVPSWLKLHNYDTDYIECEWEKTEGNYKFMLFELNEDDTENLIFKTVVERTVTTVLFNTFRKKIQLKNIKLNLNKRYRFYIYSLNGDLCSRRNIFYDLIRNDPYNLEVVSLDKDYVDLSWKCKFYSDKFEVTLHDSYMNKEKKSIYKCTKNSDDEFIVRVDELEPETNYDVYIKSVEKYNKVSGASNKVNFTTKFGIRPPSLTNLGTNCYLNCALQAISSSNRLVDTVSDLSDEIGSEVKQLFVFNSLIQIMSGRVKINNSRRNQWSIRNIFSNFSSTEIEISRNPIFQNWCKAGQQDSFELISHIMNEVYRNIRKYLEDNEKSSEKLSIKYRNLPLRITFNYVLFCGCNDTKKTPYQADLALHVPITNTPGSYALENLVDCFFKPTESKGFSCSKRDCDFSYKRVAKLVEPLPQTICIHLQRSFWNGSRMQKINNNVTFTDKLIIKERFLLNDDMNGKDKDDEVYCEYKLTAVIVHFGNVDGGHYVCYKRTGDDWYLTNDSWVNKVERKAVFKVEPYILLYETNEDLDELMKKRAEKNREIKQKQTAENTKYLNSAPVKQKEINLDDIELKEQSVMENFENHISFSKENIERESSNQTNTTQVISDKESKSLENKEIEQLNTSQADQQENTDGNKSSTTTSDGQEEDTNESDTNHK